MDNLEAGLCTFHGSADGYFGAELERLNFAVCGCELSPLNPDETRCKAGGRSAFGTCLGIAGDGLEIDLICSAETGPGLRTGLAFGDPESSPNPSRRLPRIPSPD